MNDERLFERLAAHAGPADIDPGFEDHLYAVLQREMRRTGRVSRPMLLLAAALLLALAIAGAALVGSGLIKLPDLPGGSAARLAYGFDGDIFLADWDGANPLRIADGLPPDEDRWCESFGGEGSMWSTDGRYLAYRLNLVGDLTRNEGCGPGTVYIADAEGQAVTQVPGTGWRVSWSPDSTRFATWVDLYETIGIYGIDGVRQALLALPEGQGVGGDYDPVWSPDGNSVLLRLSAKLDSGALQDPSAIWELPVNGAAPRPVPDDDPRGRWGISYSPDGTEVAYVDDEGSLVVAGADGTGSRVLIADQVIRFSGNGGPVWSPTGDRVAFNWTARRPVESGLANEIRVVDVASGTVNTVVRGAAQGFHVSGFSPEGDRILFTWPDANVDTLEDDAIWSADVDGSGAQPLVAETNWADWQPVLPGS